MTSRLQMQSRPLLCICNQRPTFVCMRRTQAGEFFVESKMALLLDVRSPAEYNHAHIPGAVNLPLFTNEERNIVGTAYKQKSREAAIKIGLDFFGPKMRGMVEEVERTISNRQQAISNGQHATSEANPCQLPIANCVFLYCWRGGMRSGAVAWLLSMYGFSVTVLAGGYKAYRNHVLQSFEQPYTFKILGGYTGSGKTELLHQLKQQGENVIDLEAIASHKGSAFGNINMPPQPSQEMFENLFSNDLLSFCLAKEPHTVPHDESEVTTSNLEPRTSNLTIWLEDESQRIGAVYIPKGLWETMCAAPVYFLDIPFEERLQHITNEYGSCNKERLANAIIRIKKRLGGLETKNALQFLEEGNASNCFRILLQYYDKLYAKGLHNRELLSPFIKTITCESVTAQNATVLLQVQASSIHERTS